MKCGVQALSSGECLHCLKGRLNGLDFCGTLLSLCSFSLDASSTSQKAAITCDATWTEHSCPPNTYRLHGTINMSNSHMLIGVVSVTSPVALCCALHLCPQTNFWVCHVFPQPRQSLTTQSSTPKTWTSTTGSFLASQQGEKSKR